jgi:hypothetical protein
MSEENYEESELEPLPSFPEEDLEEPIWDDEDFYDLPPSQSLPPTGGKDSDWSDYLAGTLYVIIGVAIAIIVGWFYWDLHGGNLEDFAFWTEGDKKWLEVIFWSAFTIHTWNITTVAMHISDGKFNKRWIWEYLGKTFETPPISLALVFIVINLGVAFGDTTLSLQEAPITVVIAFAIISAYFSRQTTEALKVAAEWLKDQMEDRFETKKKPPYD